MLPNVLLYNCHKTNVLSLYTEALRLFIKEVSASAPDLPMYYYHIPSMTGVACKSSPMCHCYWQSKHSWVLHSTQFFNESDSHVRDWVIDVLLVSVFSVFFFSVEAADVLNGIEQMIPSFQGVKYSGIDLRDLGQCVCYSQAHNWSVLYGVDEVWNLLTRSPTEFRERLL